MRLRPIALSAPIFLSTAAFTSSLAQTDTVGERNFDWIFFAIVGIPFLLGIVELVRPSR